MALSPTQCALDSNNKKNKELYIICYTTTGIAERGRERECRVRWPVVARCRAGRWASTSHRRQSLSAGSACGAGAAVPGPGPGPAPACSRWAPARVTVCRRGRSRRPARS